MKVHTGKQNDNRSVAGQVQKTNPATTSYKAAAYNPGVRQLHILQQMANNRSRQTPGNAVIQAVLKSTTFKDLLVEQQERETQVMANRPDDSKEVKSNAFSASPSLTIPSTAQPDPNSNSNTRKTSDKPVSIAIPTSAESSKEKPSYITAGFEHEFATMEDGGPFAGVPHVEIAQSSLKLCKLPFFLETDADSALELVSPPFWVQTIDAYTPVPEVQEIEQIDSMIKERLKKIVDPPVSMEQLVNNFASDPGITFTLGDITVKKENLSPTSFGKYTKDKNQVAKDTVKDIMVGKITKFKHGGIDSQVNIATDAATYAKIVAIADRSKDTSIYFRQFYDLQDYLEKAFKIGDYKGTSALPDFFQLLIRNIAGQLAVPSINRINKIQTDAYEGKPSRPGRDFEYYATTSSRVKDVSHVWIKDNIINIGIGMLTVDDWMKVDALVSRADLEKAIQSYMPPDYIYDFEVGDTRKEREEKTRATISYHDEAKTLMVKALHTMRSEILTYNLNSKTSDAIISQDPKPGFMEHDPKFIGPRQDTYLPSSKTSMVEWKQRLHLVELRSGPIGTLKNLTATIGEERRKEFEKLRWETETPLQEKIFRKIHELTKSLDIPRSYVKAWVVKEDDVVNNEKTWTQAILATYTRRVSKLLENPKEKKGVFEKINEMTFDSNTHPIIMFATLDAFKQFD